MRPLIDEWAGMDASIFTPGQLASALARKELLQIGGDETTGKGLCLARLSDGKGE